MEAASSVIARGGRASACCARNWPRWARRAVNWKRLRTCAATARLSIHAVERQSDPAMVAVVSALRATWGLPDA